MIIAVVYVKGDTDHGALRKACVEIDDKKERELGILTTWRKKSWRKAQRWGFSSPLFGNEQWIDVGATHDTGHGVIGVFDTTIPSHRDEINRLMESEAVPA